MKRSLILLALGAVLALPAWLAATPVMAQGKTPVQAERTKLMRSNGGALKKIGGAKDTASVGAAARTLAANAKALKSKWPAGSGGGASRAKPAIWQNMSDFNAKLSALGAAADNLIKVSALAQPARANGHSGPSWRNRQPPSDPGVPAPPSISRKMKKIPKDKKWQVELEDGGGQCYSDFEEINARILIQKGE